MCAISFEEDINNLWLKHYIVVLLNVKKVGRQMAKCPKCKSEISKPDKEWVYGKFDVKMYKCSCGNQFREYFRGNKLRFVLSAHNGGLGKTKIKRQ
jgi:uncharacterized protein with PIN domain